MPYITKEEIDYMIDAGIPGVDRDKIKNFVCGWIGNGKKYRY